MTVFACFDVIVIVAAANSDCERNTSLHVLPLLLLLLLLLLDFVHV